MSKPQLSRGGRPKGRVSFNAESAKAFGQAVRIRRKVIGVSQEALAHLADIERTHFSSIERGQNQPSLWLILKISKALGVTSAMLMDDTASILLELNSTKKTSADTAAVADRIPTITRNTPASI